MYFLKVSDYEIESFFDKVEAHRKAIEMSCDHSKTTKASFMYWPLRGIKLSGH